MSRAFHLGPLALFCFLAPQTTAPAVQPVAGGVRDADKVTVTLVVILAREDGNQVDPRLTQIAEEIRKLNPTLRTFRLKSMTDQALAENEKGVFKLVDDKKVEVVVKHRADRENRVGLSVTPPGQGEIVYRSVCGKFFPIVTSYQTKTRERLILALRVQPCQEK